jgi:hypothetical protein
MNRVAQSEFDLLTVAKALTGGVSAGAVEPLLRTPHTMAPQLGPTSIGLLKQILGRGAILELGRRGGWRPCSHLRSLEEVPTGRLWERHPQPVSVHFSALTMKLLQWLVASPLSVPSECKPLKGKKLTLGDQLALYLSCDLATRCELPPGPFADSPAFRHAPLCWLGFPELLGRKKPMPKDGPPAQAWEVLVTEGVVLLEALQQDLARRWVQIERGKRGVVKPQVMIAIGESQGAVLARMAELLEHHDRRDLMSFVVEAAGRVLRYRPEATWWIGGIAQVGTLSERQQAFRAAGALLEAVAIPGRWVEQAQGVRFFDDDYGASQLLLKQWEQLGPEGMAHAHQLVQRLQKLDAALGDQQTKPTEEVTQ